MEHTLVQLPEILKLAGHAVRWNVLTALARSDYRVQDLVEQLSLQQNLVSYHLCQLREGHLVTFLVNALRSEQDWPSNMSICPHM